MRNLILFIATIICTQVNSNTIYVGDETALGYKQYHKADGVAAVGSRPKHVYKYLKQINYNGVDKVILSTGISNDCNDTLFVKYQFEFLQQNKTNFVVIDDNRCAVGSRNLKLLCNSKSHCTFKSIPTDSSKYKIEL